MLTVFAFGRNYTVLFIARALQGVGSSCSSVSGDFKQIQEKKTDYSAKLITHFITKGWACLPLVIRTIRNAATPWASLLEAWLSVS